MYFENKPALLLYVNEFFFPIKHQILRGGKCVRGKIYSPMRIVIVIQRRPLINRRTGGEYRPKKNQIPGLVTGPGGY